MISLEKYISLATEGMQDFELLHSHPVFPEGTRLPILHARRYLWMINALIQSLHASGYVESEPEKNVTERDAPTVVSVGCFPGSFDRILKLIFHNRIHIMGVGLSISDDFKNAFLGKVYDEIMAVELDPLHPDNMASKYPVRIPMEDSSADAVVAGEIFEHLFSPLHFLRETSRVLKKGGKLIMTTPNISYIGNILKLIQGRSCHENLETSHIYMNSEWRPHIRIYDRYEVASLCWKNGMMKEEHTEFLDNREDRFYRSARIRLKMKLVRLAYIIPMYRNNLCQIFCKD